MFWHNLLALFIESSFWLMLGFFIAGLIKAVIPSRWLEQQLGRSGWRSTVKAAFLGAPLPLCSCGVVPAALGLKKAGASNSSTISFLVATPETGVDSISVTYALMGPIMAIVRPISAIISGITAGMLVGQHQKNQDNISVSSCCSKNKQATANLSLGQRLIEGMRFTYFDMLKDIALWLLIGLAFAAAVKTYVPASTLAEWGSSWLAFLAMTLVGIPMYICATASTPMAAGFLLSGVSPGAVLVFMLAGPATNIGTLGIITKELGKRAIIAYLGGIILSSYILGMGLNWACDYFELSISSQALMEQHVHKAGYEYISAALLAALLAYGLWQKYKPQQATTHQH